MSRVEAQAHAEVDLLAVAVRLTFTGISSKIGSAFSSVHTIGDGHWKLKVEWKGSPGTYDPNRACRVSLEPLHPETSADSNSTVWRRHVNVGVSFEPLAGLPFRTRTSTAIFTQDNTVVEFADFAKMTEISSWSSVHNSFVFRCSISQVHNPNVSGGKVLISEEVETPIGTLFASLANLFEDSTTDVVFRFPSDDNEPSKERFVFAHRKVLAAQSTYFEKLFNPGTRKKNTVVMFDQLQAAEAETSSQTVIKEEDDEDDRDWLPTAHETAEPEMGGPEKEGPGSPTLAQLLEAQEGSTGRKPKAKAGRKSTARKAASSENRSLYSIPVTDASRTTYRALIHCFYTSTLLLAEPASNYVVHVEASAEKETSGSRRPWILKRSKETGRWIPNKSPIEPASPHAVYRLAHQLGLTHVKLLAKAALIKAYTAENVLYELVSTFSHEHVEMRDAALKYTLANWDKVKYTRAFKRIVSEALTSPIEGASEIFMKLLQSTKGDEPVAKKQRLM